MSTQSNRGVAASEHVAQYVGCRSKADLRVSGPRSTSSCSFALVMWLTTQIHKQLYQYKRWSSKLQLWEQKEPPRVEKEFKQSSLLMPMHYAVIPLSFKFHRNLSWSHWVFLPSFWASTQIPLSSIQQTQELVQERTQKHRKLSGAGQDCSRHCGPTTTVCGFTEQSKQHYQLTAACWVPRGWMTPKK